MDRDSIRGLMGRAIGCLVLLIALAGALPSTSWAEPLRIWVMHNEPSEHYTDVTPDLIGDALTRAVELLTSPSSKRRLRAVARR